MSVDQEIYIDGVGSFINKVQPNSEPTILSNVWITSGIEGSDQADFVLDVVIFCDPADRFGTVSYKSPTTGKREGRTLVDNDRVEFGIKLDDGRKGTISWQHRPSGPEMGVVYKSRR